MNKSNEKVCITSSKLFLEVSSVIGKVEALEQLTKAYRHYTPVNNNNLWQWEEHLIGGFDWDGTPQRHSYWSKIEDQL